jgi:hypothetical protein
MNNNVSNSSPFLFAGVLLIFLSGTALARGELPKTTTDGQDLIESKKVDAVYWLEGATLEPYTRVLILDCHVSLEIQLAEKLQPQQGSP